jgi:brefeldin A-inhibited guanine nucleotide-exchange protein
MEDLQLRTMGLEGLTIILKSLMTSANLTTPSASAAAQATLSPGGGDESLHFEGSAGEKGEFASKRSTLKDEPSVVNGNEITVGEAGATTVALTNIVETYDKKQKLQEEIETGILRFNLSPMKGVKFLISTGHLQFTPKSVANFLHSYQEKLDKTAVGDLLGREKEYENGFCYQVLNEYVESMDFSDLQFDNAIRYFLSGFRLPGEAQKIDRIMEKFAEKYYLQHQDEFASADMAFILAFSTIMLQTNLHNPAIKEEKKMTKEQFIKQNKGISTDGELSDQLLSEIYERIAAEPISINDDKSGGMKGGKSGKTSGVAGGGAGDEGGNSSSFVVFQSQSDRKKKDAFSYERKEMVRAGEAMIRQNKRKNSTFLPANQVLSTSSSASSASGKNGGVGGDSGRGINEEVYVRPMFDLVWPPVIGVVSQLLENNDDQKIVDLCLSALHYCLVLSCRIDCATARNTFIHALAKFTSLDTIREMKPKNLSSIHLLLTIALSEGEYLDENWIQVLQAVSLLARLQLFATGSHTDDLFFSDTGSLGSVSSDSLRGSGGTISKRGKGAFGLGGSTHSTTGAGSHHHFNSHHHHMERNASINLGDPLTKLFSGPSKAEVNRLVEESNAELISRIIDPVEIDRIFINSTALSASAVTHFVRSLCEVSILEITPGSSMNSLRGKDSFNDNNSPRIFSLQKLVEVADYNMASRSRVDWANIWKLLTNHFNAVGIHENPALAMFAIDSLKQLSIKFLQKDELSNFNFQRVFLKPFETIIQSSTNDDIKDLVLRCLDIMIRVSLSFSSVFVLSFSLFLPC